MRRPYYNQEERFVIRAFPNEFYSQRAILHLESMKIKRHIDQFLTPAVDYLAKILANDKKL